MNVIMNPGYLLTKKKKTITKHEKNVLEFRNNIMLKTHLKHLLQAFRLAIITVV